MIAKCLLHVEGCRDLLESDAVYQRLREAMDTRRISNPSDELKRATSAARR
jgi:hypothetical protein